MGSMQFSNLTLRNAVNEWLNDRSAAEKKYGNISNWDTSGVTDMSKLFLDASEFNDPIGSWDVSNVRTMHAMFDNAIEYNQPLENWNTALVEDMSEMFSATSPTKFNQPIGSWNVSNVRTMNSMFFNAACFNQNINEWNISRVENLKGIFSHATSFNQPLDNWDTSSVNNMMQTFSNAKSFNQPLAKWDVSKVENFYRMFGGAVVFNQPLADWNTSSAKNMHSMFQGAFAFNQPIGSWNVSRVESFQQMFERAHQFNQPIDSWDVSNGTNFYRMFEYALAFNSPLNSWDVSKGESFDYMFYKASSFNQLMDKWKITISKDKFGKNISGGFDGFLQGAVSFNQNIRGWIDLYGITGYEDDPFQGVKSITEKKKPKTKSIKKLSLSKAYDLKIKINTLLKQYKDLKDFKLTKVDIMQGMDYLQHPAIRNQNEVLNHHQYYEFSTDNISCYAASPICHFNIEMEGEEFCFLYMNVGIDDSDNDEKEFVGIFLNDSKIKYTINSYWENIFWFHDFKDFDEDLFLKLTTLGSILSNEDASHSVFDFYAEYDDIPDKIISWSEVDNFDW